MGKTNMFTKLFSVPVPAGSPVVDSQAKSKKAPGVEFFVAAVAAPTLTDTTHFFPFYESGKCTSDKAVVTTS